jgi:hypothetical protein
VIILKELLEALPQPWKIIGITPNALNLMKKNNYNNYFKDEAGNRKSLPIQRAHLIDRDKWYNELFLKKWKSPTAWLKFIEDNDKTVLALSTENKKITTIQFIQFEDVNDLFKSTRISWRHSTKEKEYLKTLTTQQQ